MINYIIGKLIETNESMIVVENNHIGYELFFPKSNMQNLPNIGEEIKIYTYMNVKEDEISLYGFLTNDDKEMFLKLLTVNGVGPKGALNIISSFGYSMLVKAISMEDNKLIATVPGIGQKTASKICIELGDKIRKMNFDNKLDVAKSDNVKNESITKIKDDTIEALVQLGYKESKARDIVSKINITSDITASDVLKMVLKNDK